MPAVSRETDSLPRGVELELDEPSLERWAARVGRKAAEAKIFVALYGPLGSGKSTVVRAACRAAGVEGPVPSPTFTLVNRYRLPGGSRFIHHVDLYRIESEREVHELGWHELTSGDGPVFVEWAERAGSLLPPDRWDIRLDFGETSATRSVRAVSRGGTPRCPS